MRYLLDTNIVSDLVRNPQGVESILEGAVATTSNSSSRRRSREEMRAFYDALAAHSDKIPQLPDEAFTRESFYQDHD